MVDDSFSVLTRLSDPARRRASTGRRRLSRANARRRSGMRARMQKHPRGRRHRRDRPCPRLRHSTLGKNTRRARDQRRFRIGWPGKNRNGNQPEDAPPVLPLADLHEIVRSHQPDEPTLRKARQQERQRVGRMRGAEPPLDVGHADARMPGDPCRRLQPFLERRRVARALQRVLRRQHPPDFVEAQPLQRQQRDVPVSLVGRVERAAEQPDPARAQGSNPGAVRSRRTAQHAARADRRRTCPRTRQPARVDVGVTAGIGRSPGRRT